MLREFAENIKAGLAECRLSANFQRFGKCWITLFSGGSILSDIALFSTSKAAFNIVYLIKNCEKLSHFHKILCATFWWWIILSNQMSKLDLTWMFPIFHMFHIGILFLFDLLLFRTLLILFIELTLRSWLTISWREAETPTWGLCNSLSKSKYLDWIW